MSEFTPIDYGAIVAAVFSVVGLLITVPASLSTQDNGFTAFHYAAITLGITLIISTLWVLNAVMT